MIAFLSASLAPGNVSFLLDAETSAAEEPRYLQSGEVAGNRPSRLYVDVHLSGSEPSFNLVVSNGSDRELQALADEWRRERGPTSSALKAAMHPAYLRLIGKGPRAVPFLLRELQNEPDHWFLALMAITGEDPVPEEARGDLLAMADAWVQWGKRERII